MVGLDNPLHIAIVLIVVLLVFGAKRLPEMGKSMGEGLRGFKESMSGESPAPKMLTSEPTRVEDQTTSTTSTTPASDRTPEPVA